MGLHLPRRLPRAGDPERLQPALLGRPRHPGGLAAGAELVPHLAARADRARPVEQGLGVRDHRRPAPRPLRPLAPLPPLPRRRATTMGPLVVTATLLTITSWIQLIAIVRGKQAPLSNLSYVEDVGLVAFVLTSFLGLALTRRARGAVGDLVVELERSGPGGVRGALARAIGDPTLELALWLPDRGIWVDEQGREVELPTRRTARSRSSATTWRRSSTTRCSTTSRRCSRRPGRRRGSRSRTSGSRPSCAPSSPSCASPARASSRAADDERRRLERDLHDGAQQRLLGIGMALQLLREQGRRRADARAPRRDRGRGAARRCTSCASSRAASTRPCSPTTASPRPSRTLAERSPVPVDVDAVDERLPAEIETAVYFVVAEALANIAKHAHAPKASVRSGTRTDRFASRSHDDGVGGAALDGGSGLRGLADRADALDGGSGREPARAAARRSSWRSRARRDRRRHRAPARRGSPGCSRKPASRSAARQATPTSCSRSSRRRAPDAAIVDIRMPPTHSDEGLVAADEIRELLPQVGVLVLSQYVETSYALRLVDGGDRAGAATSSRTACSTPRARRRAGARRRGRDGGRPGARGPAARSEARAATRSRS